MKPENAAEYTVLLNECIEAIQLREKSMIKITVGDYIAVMPCSVNKLILEALENEKLSVIERTKPKPSSCEPMSTCCG